MDCNPKPEVPCGNLIPDTCVTIVDTTIFNSCPSWVTVQKGGCYRQSDLNRVFGIGFCTLFGITGKPGTCVDGLYIPGAGILGSIYLGCIEDCEGDPIPSTVREAIIDLYGEVCALKTGLNISIGDINTKCLTDPCGVPITTVGGLFQALVDEVCDSVGTLGVYRAILTSDSGGVLAPTVTVFENSIKFGGLPITITWTRTGAGVFLGTASQPVFVAGKTYLNVGQNVVGVPAYLSRTSTTTLDLNSSGSDSGLVDTSVEIRIYP